MLLHLAHEQGGVAAAVGSVAAAAALERTWLGLMSVLESVVRVSCRDRVRVRVSGQG